MSQWSPLVPKAGDTACFRACRVILANLGAPPGTIPEGTVRRFQCSASPGVPDPVETAAASQYLRRECSAGRGVICGIDYKEGVSQNRDKITDHFVVLAAVDTQHPLDVGREELRGLNPGANVQPGMEYNVAFVWSETRGAWVRSFPERLEGTLVSMVVPDVATGATLKDRP